MVSLVRHAWLVVFHTQAALLGRRRQQGRSPSVGWLKEHLLPQVPPATHAADRHHCRLYQDPGPHAYMTNAMHAAKACPVIEGRRSCPQAPCVR